MQIGLDVDVDPGAPAEDGFEPVLDLCGDVVRLDDRGGGVDLDVHVDDEYVAVFAGAQVVESDDAGCLLYFLGDVLFHFFRERAFEQFLYAGSGEFVGYTDDEQSHDNRGNGVEYAPALAQEHGSRNAYERAYRREGVGTVVPAVGDDGGAVDFAAYDNGVPIEPFFHDYRDGGHDKSQIGGALDDAPVEDFVYLHAARIENADGDDKEGEADEHGGECLVFPVAVGVVAIFVFRGDFDKDNHDEIGDEIGEGVYSVGNHGAASSYDAGCDFGGREDEVDKESHPSDAGGFFLPNGIGQGDLFVHFQWL